MDPRPSSHQPPAKPLRHATSDNDDLSLGSSTSTLRPPDDIMDKQRQVRGTVMGDGIPVEALSEGAGPSRPPSFTSIEILPTGTLHDRPSAPDSTSSDEKRGDDIEREQEVEMIDGRPKDVYDRFTKAQKARILLIVSYSAIIAPMTSSIFLPAIPQMADDLHTTPSVINITVAVFILVIGIAPVLWSPYAGFYGRRPVYLASMPVMVVASIGVALCHNIAGLTGTRVLQGIGSSCFLAVGAGSIGDIFRPTERARGMSTFYMVVLLGPAISPVIAGVFAEYTAATWRSTQYFLAGCGALSVVLVFFFLPETSHPPLPHDTLKLERGKKFVWFWCNPFKSLGLLRWPNIALVCFISSCGMIDTYCLLIPLSAVFKDRYHIHNLAISGCLYLSNGIGNVLGSKLAGPISDATVKHWIKKRGYRRPEDRLRSAFFGIGVLMPASILVYGWVLEYGAGGMAPPLIMVLLNGLALSLAFAPLNTYLVDSMQTRSAEVIAVNNCVRYVFAAVASAVVLPIANSIGWGPTMTICFGLTMVSAFALWLVYRYGDRWREASNKKYGMTHREADEEKVDGGKDEESAIPPDGHSVIETSAEIAHRPGLDPTGADSEVGEHGEPAPLDSRGRTQPSRKGARPELARHTTRGEMPPVEEVLKRTVSLSGASAHGGG